MKSSSKYEEKVHHSEGITNLWKRLTYLVAIPAVLLVAIPVGKVELSHAEHRKHQAHLSDDEWPQQYDYQNIRLKPYFGVMVIKLCSGTPMLTDMLSKIKIIIEEIT